MLGRAVTVTVVAALFVTTTSAGVGAATAAPLQRTPASDASASASATAPTVAPTAVPVPNPDLLAWTQHEVGVMITFNMATMLPKCTGNGLCASVGGCNADLPGPPPVSTFNPVDLDTDQWADVMVSYGAKYAVMVIQHCGGFAMWPTNEYVLKETGFNYTYSVDFTPWGAGQRDIMREFVASCTAKGIKPAVYYSLNHNWYLNVASAKVQPGPLKPGQANVTQAQYEAIALAQYTQLLTQYGFMAEVWFDGGMDNIPGFGGLISKAQPHAGYFNGDVAAPANNVRWIGTESGLPAYPIWSTTTSYATAGTGTPGGAVFNPSETDTCFTQADHWFYSPTLPIRTLQQLVDVYLHSVGQNSQLMMNLAPDMTGRVTAEHAARYAAAGAWVSACFGDANTVATTSGTGTSYTLGPLSGSVDRVVIQEDQSHGQRVTAYSLLDAGTGAVLGNGTAVGHKRIHVLDSPVAAQATLTLRIDSSLASPVVSRFAAFGPDKCVVPSSGE